MDRSYCSRLQKWVEDQAPRDRRGALAKLHRRFQLAAAELNEDALSVENLRLWRDGVVKGELAGRSLRQLARVRGESPEQVTAWLKGTSVESSPGNGLIGMLSSSSEGEILAAIRFGIQFLESRKVSGVCAVGRLIREEFAARGLNPDSLSDFQVFVDAGQGTIDASTAYALQQLLVGRRTAAELSRGEMASIALALSEFSGKDFSGEYLRRLATEGCTNSSSSDRHLATNGGS